MQTKLWFERRFVFDLPVWMYPNVVERLRGTPAGVEALVRDVSSEVLVHRPGEGWSIQENVGHLLDLEPLWMGRLDDLLSGTPRLRDADLTNQRTHQAHHNAHPISDILKAFRMARIQLVQRLDTLDEASVECTAMHPRLEQPMRLLDLVFFVAEHDDHHLAQVSRLKRLLV